MSVEVTLPSLGVAILEATVVKWLKEEGQPVAKEEPIAEVESDRCRLKWYLRWTASCSKGSARSAGSSK